MGGFHGRGRRKEKGELAGEKENQQNREQGPVWKEGKPQECCVMEFRAERLELGGGE